MLGLEVVHILAIIAIILLAASAGYGVYAYRRGLPPFRPRYFSGGGGHIINMGIGTPGEVPSFLTFGLAMGVATAAVAVASALRYHIYRRRRRQ